MKIKINNGEVIFKDDKRRLLYETDVLDNLSIYLDYVVNANNDVDKCFVDFRIHKGNGKINAMYLLRVYNDFSYFSLKRRSKKGKIANIVSQKISYDSIMNMKDLKNGIDYVRDNINKFYLFERDFIPTTSNIPIGEINNDIINNLLDRQSRTDSVHEKIDIDKVLLKSYF